MKYNYCYYKIYTSRLIIKIITEAQINILDDNRNILYKDNQFFTANYT